MRQRDSYENATCVKEEQKGSMNIQRYLIRSLLKETQWSFDLRILLEDYRLDKVQQMMNARLPEDERLTDAEIKEVVEADPTTHGDMTGKYVEWLMKQYLFMSKEERSRFFEDLYKYTNALRAYHELKTRNKVSEKDINRIKTLEQLQSIIETDEIQSVIEGFPDTKELEASGSVVVLLRHPQLHLYDVINHKADVALGSNTHWCTVPSSKTFYSYKKNGHIFILYAKENGEIERYQFHFESNQFMDEDDHRDEKWLNDPRVSSTLIEYGRKIESIGIATYYKDRELLSLPSMQEKAVKAQGSNIQYIDDPSEKIQLLAIKPYTMNLQYIKNPTEKVAREAILNTPSAIKYIDNPSIELQLLAVQRERTFGEGEIIPLLLSKNVPVSNEVLLAALKRHANTIQYIKWETPAEAIDLLKINPRSLNYIKKQTDEMIETALTLDPKTLRFVKSPSENQIWYALKKMDAEEMGDFLDNARSDNSYNVRRGENKKSIISHFTPSMISYMLEEAKNDWEQYGRIFEHLVPIMGDDQLQDILQEYPKMIKYVLSPSRIKRMGDFLVPLVEKDPETITIINNPSLKLQKVVLRTSPEHLLKISNLHAEIIESLVRDFKIEPQDFNISSFRYNIEKAMRNEALSADTEKAIVEQYPRAIAWVWPTRRKPLIGIAVKQDASLAVFANDPELKMLAVQAEPQSILHMKGVPQAVAQEALRLGFADAIAYIKNPDEELIINAVQKNPKIFGEILEMLKKNKQEPSEKLQVAAIKAEVNNLVRLRNAGFDAEPAAQLQAISMHKNALSFILMPTEDALALHKELWEK